MPKSSKGRRCKLMNWMRHRKGGRLSRLEAPAEILSDQIIMFDPVNVNSQLSESSCIQHQPSPGKTGRSIVESNIVEICTLDLLPPELIDHIIKFLDVQDVENLSVVSIKLNRHVTASYYCHLMLPCDINIEKEVISGGYRILKLTCTRCLRMLEDPVSGRYIFSEINLSHLKELNLSGLNYVSGMSRRHVLSDLYIRCLTEILMKVEPESLVKLEFLTDDTPRIPDNIAPLLKKFTRLKKLILHGSRMSSRIQYQNIGDVLLPILNSSHANHVELKSYADYFCGVPMVISCPWITSLVVDFGNKGNNANFSLEDMTNLERLNTPHPCRGLTNQCPCLRCFNNGGLLESIIAQSPKFRYFNEIDLKELEETHKEGEMTNWKDIITSMGTRFCQLSHELARSTSQYF